MKNFSERELNEIHDMLHGKIEGRQKEDFMARLNENVELKSEFEFWKSIEEGLRYNQYSASAKEAQRKVFTRSNPFIFFFRNKKARRSIAAGILVVATVGLTVWIINPSDKAGIAEGKSDKDSTSHTETPQSPVPKITLEDLLANNLIIPIENVPQKFESAVDKINQSHQRQRGISELQALSRPVKSTDKEDEPLFGASGEKSVEPEGLSREEKVYQNLYLGIAYLKSKEYSKALSHLENAKENKEAQWYLALTYLAQKDIPKTIELARNVAEDKNNPYNTQADQLLEQLKQHEK